MTTQSNVSNVSPVGRNRGARKGAAVSNPKGNIGSHMTGKAQTPAIKQVGQDLNAKIGTLPKAIVTKAQAIVHGFSGANVELNTIKQQLDAKRGGLSDIVFRVILLGWEEVDNKKNAYRYCEALLNSAELAERQSVKRAQKLEDLPTAKAALGASWQTYKSQLLKCLHAGIDPTQFKSGTKYREAASNIRGNGTKGEGKRGTKKRNDKGTDAVAEGATELRSELSAAIVEFIAAMRELDEEQQLEYANQLHEMTTAIGAQSGEEAGEEDAATASM